MAQEKDQSAIREVQDQLFLGTADGNRLNIVGSNLGLDRPVTGYTDAEWRALIRKIALNPKNIRRAVRHVLEICLGPKHTRVTNLAGEVLTGDETIFVTDYEEMVQTGTLVLDPGTAGEETLDYIYIDRSTGEVCLSTPVANDHFIMADADALLVSDISIGATSMQLTDTAEFPLVGFPYSVHLGYREDSSEEVTVVSNNPATNTLGISATTLAHKGFESAFLRRFLVNPASAGSVFVVLDTNDADDFPESGWVRLGTGTGSEEIVEYTSVDSTLNILFLATPLQNAHIVNESVELLKNGVEVKTAGVVERGIGWSIYETTPRIIYVVLPAETATNRIIDASYLHKELAASVGSTLAVATTVTDTVITLASTASFPEGGQLITIDSGEDFFYTSKDDDNDTLTLTKPVGAVYGIGDAVDTKLVNYGGTDLPDGNPRDAGGSVLDDRFPGPYVFELLLDGISTVNTTLNQVIPPRTYVAVDQVASRSCVELVDGSLWPLPPFTPFNVRIGDGTSLEEEVIVNDFTPAGTASTINGSFGPADTTITLADSSGFPEESSGFNAGYQVLFDNGSDPAETVTVLTNDGATDLTIVGPLVYSYTTSDDVTLINDTISVDPIVFNRTGRTAGSLGDTVDILYSNITLASTAGLPNTGSVHLNYGNSVPSVRQRIVAVTNPNVSFEVEDGTEFPSGLVPFQAVINEGKTDEERVSVTGIASDVLTAASTNLPVVDAYVELRAGDSEIIEYQDIDGSNLTFSPEIALIDGHLLGEPVYLIKSASEPRTDGFSYPFYLPVDKTKCIKFALDLVRAAGIEVKFVELES